MLYSKYMKFEIQIDSNSSLIAESSITVGYLKKKTKSNKDKRKIEKNASK